MAQLIAGELIIHISLSQNFNPSYTPPRLPTRKLDSHFTLSPARRRSLRPLPPPFVVQQPTPAQPDHKTFTFLSHMASVGFALIPFNMFGTSLMSESNKPRPQYQNQGYLPNGASSGPTPGAQALLPNNGRVIQSGPTRILCVADVRGLSRRSTSRAALTKF